jgi:hypothetical protein
MCIPRGHWQERQRAAFLDEGSAPPKPNMDGPAIMAVATAVAGEDGRTCKTPSALV